MANIKRYFVFFTDLVTTVKDGIMSAKDKRKLDGIAENANNYSHPTTAGNKHIPAGGSAGKILRWSSDGTATWGDDNNTTYSAATQSAQGLLSAADKKKLDGIAEKANNYSHPTTAGNKHIPAGGSVGKILRWSSDGTATWGDDNNTTYSAATQSAQGLMSAADKKKLDGIAERANNITVDSTLSKTSENPVQNKVIATEIENLKKSASDGKTSVANAITSMGVSTATDADFATMAENIKKIYTGTDTSDANALASQILKNQTAYVKGSKVIGTMENRGSLNWSGNNTTYAVPAGYYSGGTLDSRASYQSGYNSGYTAGQNAAKLKYTDGTVASFTGNNQSIIIPNTTIDCGFQPDIIIVFSHTEGLTSGHVGGDGMPIVSINYPYQTGYIRAHQYGMLADSYELDSPYTEIFALYPNVFANIANNIDDFARTHNGFSIGPITVDSNSNFYYSLKYKAIKFT